MAQRFLLTLLIGILGVGLSCAVSPPGGFAARDLPAVAAAPPASEPAPDPDVERARRSLARRNTGLSAGEERELARVLVEEARARGLEPALVLAVVHVESRFQSYAVSPVGALGLMQILPSTGEELAAKLGIPWRGAQTLFDPFVNVRLGVAYLEELSSRYDGDLATALAAYNWGPGAIDRRLRRGRGLPEEYPRLVREAHATHRLPAS